MNNFDFLSILSSAQIAFALSVIAFAILFFVFTKVNKPDKKSK